jgi:hypothetical protein
MLSVLNQVGRGFLVKSIASFDDTLTRIPVISLLTGTRQGRVVFSIGSYLALTLILFLTLFFSEFLGRYEYARETASGLIFALAILVYFNVFAGRADEQLRIRLSKISTESASFFRILGVGFLVSFVTLVDDVIVLIPLFLGDNLNIFLSFIGVYIAATVQILIVIYFGGKLEKIKHKNILASASLLILSVLVLIGAV